MERVNTTLGNVLIDILDINGACYSDELILECCAACGIDPDGSYTLRELHDAIKHVIGSDMRWLMDTPRKGDVDIPLSYSYREALNTPCNPLAIYVRQADRNGQEEADE